jgi:hypothetical protein
LSARQLFTTLRLNFIDKGAEFAFGCGHINACRRKRIKFIECPAKACGKGIFCAGIN